MKKIFSRIKKNDWQIIAAYYCFMLPMVYIANSEVGRHELISWQGLRWIFIYLLDYSLDILVLILVVFWIFHDYFQQKKFVRAIFLVMGLMVLQRLVQPWIIPWMYEHLNENVILKLAGGIENNFLSMVGLTMFLIVKKYYESKNQIMQLQKEKKESELRLLKAQIDPHFLFNNLNILDILININPVKASIYTKRLSSLYRYIIRHKDQDVVSLQEEWSFSEDYIFLLSQRFEDLFIFKHELDEIDLESYFIPPAAMQTLLENIVKHNFARPEQPICTLIYVENNHLCVKNDYRPKEEVKDSMGTGLDNLKKRIQFLTDQTLLIQQSTDDYLVKVPLVKLV